MARPFRHTELADLRRAISFAPKRGHDYTQALNHAKAEAAGMDRSDKLSTLRVLCVVEILRRLVENHLDEVTRGDLHREVDYVIKRELNHRLGRVRTYSAPSQGAGESDGQ